MNIVLVHGAWEGSWGWEEVVPLFESQGHRVLAVDLPRIGAGPMPIAEITLDRYAATVVKALEEFDGKVVLVGHSLAGAVISTVCERHPERIERLTFVAAFLLENQQSVLEAMQRDEGGELLAQLVFSEDQSYIMVPEQAGRTVALGDVSEERVERALARLAEKQATQPFMAPLQLTPERFGSVPKTFLRAAHDKVMSPALQDRMIENWSVAKVVNLQSGHFPTLALPQEVAKALQ